MGFALISCVTILVVGSVEAVVEYSQVNGNAEQKKAVLRREMKPTKIKIHESPDPYEESYEDDGSDKDDEKKVAWGQKDDGSDKDDEENVAWGPRGDTPWSWANVADQTKVKKSQTSGPGKVDEPMHDEGDTSSTSMDKETSQSGDEESGDSDGLSSKNGTITPNSSNVTTPDQAEETDSVSYRNRSNSSINGTNPPPPSGGAESDDVGAAFYRNGSNSSNGTTPSGGAESDAGAASSKTPREKRHQIEREAIWAEKIDRHAHKLEEAGAGGSTQNGESETKEKSLEKNSKEKKIDSSTENSEGGTGPE